MNALKFLSGVIRLPFLPLAVVCVLVGVGTAFWQTGDLNGWYVALAFVGGLAAHITVNVFNEYFDFRSRLDTVTRRTPFSGGSGTLPAQPHMLRATLVLGCTTAGIVAAIGLFFALKQGWMILLPGALGLFLAVTYTIWWTNNPVLCLLAPGLGFGVLMVLGTHFALTGRFSLTALIASLALTFLVSNLLLLNQFPDVEADRTVGRRHFPIQIGRKRSSQIFGLFYLLTFAAIVLGVIFQMLPVFCLLAVIPAALAWRAYRGAYQNADQVQALLPSLGLNVITNLVTPVLLAIGLFAG